MPEQPIYWVNSDREMNDAITEAAALGRRSVVLFTAPSWCRPCQVFEPHFLRAAENVDDINFIAVDLDDNAWATVDYGVQSVPTCWLFNEAGIFEKTMQVPQGALPFINDIRS